MPLLVCVFVKMSSQNHIKILTLFEFYHLTWQKKYEKESDSVRNGEKTRHVVVMKQ